MPFGDAHLKALGRITVEFSSLEHLLDAVIGLLIQHEFDEVGEILTAQLSFKRKVDVIDSLTRHRFEDEGLRKRMHGLLGEIIHAEEERNKIVHSSWFAKTPEGLLSRAKMSARRGKGFQLDYEKVSVDAINAVADKIRGTIEKLFEMAKEISGKMKDTK